MYTNYGDCGEGSPSSTCGVKTGFHVQLQRYLSSLEHITIRTGLNSSESDPLTITIEATGQYYSRLYIGTSWTLIYNGTTGLDVDPGRNVTGPAIYMAKNVTCRSFRFLVTSKRGTSDAVQYGDIQLYGYSIY